MARKTAKTTDALVEALAEVKRQLQAAGVPTPSWAESGARIKAFRKAIGLSQQQFARAVGVARPVLTRSEMGTRVSDGVLIAVGNYAAERQLNDEAMWFWQQAGVRVRDIVPGVLQLVKESTPPAQVRLTSVPSNKNVPGHNDYSLSYPEYLLPNPITASFIVVHDDALEPMFKRGDHLIIDESDTDTWKLIGSPVVAYRVASWNESVRKSREKLTDAEFEKYLSDRSGRIGFYAGWLRSSSRGADSTVAIESPNVLGGISSTPIAFEISAISGSSVKRKIDVPEFIVLGRIVASISGSGISVGSKNDGTEGRAEKYGRMKNRSKKPAKRKK